MRRGAVVVGLGAAALVGALLVPAGSAEADGRAIQQAAEHDDVVGGRCLTLELRAETSWRARQSALVGYYADVTVDDALVTFELDESCTDDPRGRVSRVDVFLEVDDLSCSADEDLTGEECGPIATFTADEEGPGVTAGAAGTAVGPLGSRRVLGHGALCVPVLYAIDVAWDEGAAQTVERVEERTQLCTAD